MASEPIYYLAKETQHIVIIIFGYHIVCQIMNYFLAKTHITHSLIASVQTSPISSVARGKGTTKEIGDVWTQANSLKADTHEGFCSRSMLQYHFARVSTHEGALFAPGACSQVFNRLNIVEHFAGWKFCSRGWSIPMKSLVHTEELCSRSVPLEQNPSCVSALKPGSRTQLPEFNLFTFLLCKCQGSSIKTVPRKQNSWGEDAGKLKYGDVIVLQTQNWSDKLKQRLQQENPAIFIQTHCKHELQI